MSRATDDPRSSESTAERECFSFVLAIEGETEITSEVENALFEAGCDDALVVSVDGKLSLHFDREAASMQEAISSAIENVEVSGAGLRVSKVIPAGAGAIRQANAFLLMRRKGENNPYWRRLFKK